MRKDKCFFTCISLLLHQPLARRASQTGATFNYLLVNRPPDTCKNKAGVRGAGAVSLPAPHSTPHDPALGLPRSRRGQAGPELPEERRGERGRAGLGRARGCAGQHQAFPAVPRAQRVLSSRTYRNIFQRIRGDHALFFPLRRPIRLSVPVPPPLYFPQLLPGSTPPPPSSPLSCLLMHLQDADSFKLRRISFWEVKPSSSSCSEESASDGNTG